MSNPEIVIRDGIIYRLTRVPDGQKRLPRKKRPAIEKRVPGRSAWAR